MTLRLSPARFIAVVSALFTMYSTARVGVLFFEALSIVRAERAEDYELLELCQRAAHADPHAMQISFTAALFFRKVNKFAVSRIPSFQTVGYLVGYLVVGVGNALGH